MTIINWTERAAELCSELVEAGKLSSPALQNAVKAIPRHLFVPTFYEADTSGNWSPVSEHDPDAHDRWCQQLYRNVSLVTAIGEINVGSRDETGPTSSSSAPGLMTRMIEMLNLRQDHAVLEIGTGTGYNAALLCHLLGDNHVCSIDVDKTLVDTARARLAEIRYHPTLAAADGFDGYPERGPYDRILATCAVSWVPSTWTTQLARDGMVLVDLKAHATAGNLVRLHREGDRLEGRFDTGNATFMQMRTEAFDAPHLNAADRERTSDTPNTVTTLDIERPWEHTVPWFLLHLSEPGRVNFGYTGDPESGRLDTVFFTSPDGSWSEIEIATTEGGRRVWQGGPRKLWTNIETTFQQWQHLGEPGWNRFGLTVEPDGRNRVWLDEPTGNGWSLIQQS